MGRVHHLPQHTPRGSRSTGFLFCRKRKNRQIYGFHVHSSAAAVCGMSSSHPRSVCLCFAVCSSPIGERAPGFPAEPEKGGSFASGFFGKRSECLPSDWAKLSFELHPSDPFHDCGRMPIVLSSGVVPLRRPLYPPVTGDAEDERETQTLLDAKQISYQ